MRALAKTVIASAPSKALWIVLAVAPALASCSHESPQGESPDSLDPTGDEDSGSPIAEAAAANVTAVRVTGVPGAYTFAVTLRSPDTGCEQYANWWEVITPNGELIYRRILAHSHVDEQPFTRSGGPVDLEDTARAIVRGHMNEAGYGGVAFSGSPAEGFAADANVTSSFASELGDAAPQPTGCAF